MAITRYVAIEMWQDNSNTVRMEKSYLSLYENGVFEDTLFYTCTKKKRLNSAFTYPNCDKESFSIAKAKEKKF